MTGNRCILDTSIAIHTFKNNFIAQQLNNFSEILISSIAVGELLYGAYRSKNTEKHLAQVHKFLLKCLVIAPDIETADFYGNIKTVLMNKGKPIPDNDIWIAAMSVQFDLPLFTSDKHFKEIENISLIPYNPE
jgi:tRNA(fMet)-specific endonuclease VapC